MTLWPRAAWLLPLAIAALPVRQVLRTPHLPLGAAGNAAARERVASVVRQREPGLRRITLEHFPGDLWSQGDDFSNGERHLVNELAAREGMRPSAVLDAIDHDIRTRPLADPAQQRQRGTVAPCMPRPFYD